MNGRQVQVPLLPQLVVLRVGSLWWRLPLVVLSPRLEDVTYKRLSGTDGGAFVMTDLQVMREDGKGRLPFALLQHCLPLLLLLLSALCCPAVQNMEEFDGPGADVFANLLAGE